MEQHSDFTSRGRTEMTSFARELKLQQECSRQTVSNCGCRACRLLCFGPQWFSGGGEGGENGRGEG